MARRPARYLSAKVGSGSPTALEQDLSRSTWYRMAGVDSRGASAMVQGLVFSVLGLICLQWPTDPSVANKEKGVRTTLYWSDSNGNSIIVDDRH